MGLGRGRGEAGGYTEYNGLKYGSVYDNVNMCGKKGLSVANNTTQVEGKFFLLC